MKMTEKNYRCVGTTCTKTRKEKTNHFGKIYNIPCPVCISEGRGPLSVWECTDPVPENGWVPEEWTTKTVIIRKGD